MASRPEAGHEIDSILLHDTEGSYQSALGIFQNPKTYASAHYLIRASDGPVTQTDENNNEGGTRATRASTCTRSASSARAQGRQLVP
ncbi:hypothetical protein SAM23877_2211 [Streptomyces ambofaciens ATCC 23877]|uniref:N-acetylmuramoyl-L-alanine amidase domain-containing protein n=1 Tax=Streptomyces ambofaciens (strain ATCC 23877 / 3486 / DSM 40053 / JCM 4204 / NBRC 12836 / NRRL B-2516) TaxID=278992 RepID=A0A0K2AQ68_STRA7|nr:hypothetical protein SAM23877_2211 [Streptomyces ambofaciens ATCC 23877]